MKTQRATESVVLLCTLAGSNMGWPARATAPLTGSYNADEVLRHDQKNIGFTKVFFQGLAAREELCRVRAVPSAQPWIPAVICKSRREALKAIGLGWLMRWVCRYSLEKMYEVLA
jgi:hypothetical protein